MEFYWQNLTYFMKPKAKIMSIDQIDDNLWTARCLGRTKTYNANGNKAAQIYAEFWLIKMLKEITIELERIHAG